MFTKTLLRSLVVASVSLGLVVTPSVAALADDASTPVDDKASTAKPAESTVAKKDDSAGTPKEAAKDDTKAEKPAADPQDSKADPKDPKADPKETKADPKDPKADPKDPKADPKETKADPKDPKADPKDPKADPKDPKANKDPKLSKEEADKLKKDKNKTDGKLVVKAISVAAGVGAVDTAYLIDTTASMHDDIATAIALAKKNGSKVHRLGGRTAIVEFRDGYCDPSNAVRVVLDFGTDAKKFNEALDSLQTNYRGSCGQPESMLAGMRAALEKLSWKEDGGRAVVVMTDAGFHDPDYDGTTFEYITNAVSKPGKTIRVYPLITTPEWLPSSEVDKYEDIAGVSGGDVVTGKDSLEKAIDQIAALPVVSVPLPEYTIMPGDLRIDLSRSFVPESAKDATYEINCNGDGKTWVKISDPSAAMCTFTDVGTYTVNVRLTLDNGVKSSTMTKVVVTNDPLEVKPAASVVNLTADKAVKTSATRGKVTLQWEASEDPFMWFITVNGRPVGTVDGSLRTLTLEDLVLGSDAIVKISGVSSSGLFGSTETLRIDLPEPSSLADPKDSAKDEKKDKDTKKASSAKKAHAHSSAALAATGSDASHLALIAFLIVAAGVPVIALRRRTSTEG